MKTFKTRIKEAEMVALKLRKRGFKARVVTRLKNNREPVITVK